MDSSTKLLIAELETEVLSSITDVNIKRTIKAVFKTFVNRKEDVIKMQSVTSSTIKAIGYEPVTEKLRIDFLTGGTYDYPGVPASVYADLMTAPSHGRYFAAFIRSNYGTVKVK